MASGTIVRKKEIKHFDITVPSGNTQFDFSSVKPSDYTSSGRLCACSVYGAAVAIAQLSPTTVYFANTLNRECVVRILYEV